MKQIIAAGGKLRGYIRETGERKELLDSGGMVLGYYDSVKDQTYLPGGRLFGFGDQLMSLLED